MDEELRSHIESRTETNMRAGMSAKEARVAALRQFGSADLIKEQCRDQRGAMGREFFPGHSFWRPPTAKKSRLHVSGHADAGVGHRCQYIRV